MLICNTFLHSVSSTFLCLNATLFLFQYLLKFSRFVCLQHFSPIQTYKTFLYLLICNTFLHSVSSTFFFLNATLFLLQYLLKFSKFVCLQHFSQIYTYKTFLYLLICYIYMQHFFNFCNFTTSLNLFICNTFLLSLFVKILWICFVCNTFLQLTLINLFSSCLYPTLFQLLSFYNFSQSVYTQDCSVFSIYKTSLHLITYNTFLLSVFIKLLWLC